MPDGALPHPTSLEPDDFKIQVKFQGEWMHCKKCGAKEKSHKNRQSNWSFIQVDNGGFYICNRCYSKKTVQELLAAYLKPSENG